MKVDVAILSANFNNGKYLDQFFQSIINSSFQPSQIILVDDKSTDDSIEIINKYRYIQGLELICLSQNQGFANALNEGIKYVKAKYVLRVDPDDVISPFRIEKQFLFLENNTNIDVIGSNAQYFSDSINNILSKSNFVQNHNEIYKRYEAGTHGVMHGTTMLRANIFKIYKYHQESVPAEDYKIFSEIIKDGYKFENLLDSLTFVRIHKNSVSNDLPYNTILKTYELRDLIFGKRTSRISIVSFFIHMKFYRRFLFEKNLVWKLFYLIIAVMFNPVKVIKRFI